MSAKFHNSQERKSTPDSFKLLSVEKWIGKGRIFVEHFWNPLFKPLTMLHLFGCLVIFNSTNWGED
jgi:hypothetical protein